MDNQQPTPTPQQTPGYATPKPNGQIVSSNSPYQSPSSEISSSGRQMKVISRVGILSAGKIYGVLMAAMGLLIGVPYGIIMMIFGGVMGASGGEAGLAGGAMGFIIGLVMIIIIPLFYGGLGFVMGVIGAWIYNMVSGWIGGLQIELEDV